MPKHGNYSCYAYFLEDFEKDFTIEYAETHYYTYFVREGRLHYERTTGTEDRAEERCAEIRKWKDVDDAFWTLNKVIKGVFV